MSRILASRLVLASYTNLSTNYLTLTGMTGGGGGLFSCVVSGSVLFVGVVGDGRRWLDAAPVPVLRVLRRPGARPPARFCRCCGLCPVYAGHGQGPSGPAGPSPTPGVGCTAIGRQGGPSSVRCRASAGVVCSSLPVRPGARRPPAPGFIKRRGYREGLGAGPIRPLFRLKERHLR